MTDSDKGLPVSCQCGNISFRTPSSKPISMAHCHCTDCRKQSTSAFGTSAHWPAKDVLPLSPELEEKLAVFTHPTDSGNTKYCYFCPKCGTRILHVSHLPDGTVRETVPFRGGVVDGLDWTGVKHIYTRSAVMKIPADWETYETFPGDKTNKA
ncbi:Mss4-like protein [Coniochaeta sp. 2T2.1]|nr:Mss4-like protein [Coniochaeta sp. 2T2.1]